MCKRIASKVKNLLCALLGSIISRVKFHDKEYFLCSRGIGDTIIFLSKLEQFKQLYPEKKLNIILQENHRVIASGYQADLDTVQLVNRTIMWWLYRAEIQNLLPRNINFILPKNGFTKLGETYSIVDLIDERLHLKEHRNKLKAPTYSWMSNRKKVVITESGAVKGKSVILSPYAFSVPQINIKYWEQIAYIYSNNGYHVITNTGGSEELPLPGTTEISLPLDETYLLAEYCGDFIGLRSGLCDLLAFSSCEMTVLYPRMGEHDWKEKYTFAHMGFQKNIQEIQEGELDEWMLKLEKELSNRDA